MTVTQLIAKLAEFDGEMEVRLYGGGSGHTEACSSVECVHLNSFGEVSDEETDRETVLIG